MMIGNSPACSIKKKRRKNDKGMTQAVGYNQDSGQQKKYSTIRANTRQQELNE
jgi:hypothetical protein